MQIIKKEKTQDFKILNKKRPVSHYGITGRFYHI